MTSGCICDEAQVSGTHHFRLKYDPLSIIPLIISQNQP